MAVVTLIGVLLIIKVWMSLIRAKKLTTTATESENPNPKRSSLNEDQ